MTTNPAVPFSGNGSESKFDTLGLLPESFIPKTIKVTPETDFETVKKKMHQASLAFPLIAKPDCGFRGYMVKKIDSFQDLKAYHEAFDETYLIQEFVPHLNEIGVFYHRMPNEPEGKVSSVTLKRFIRLKGDGHSSLAELIENDDRAFLYFDLFKSIHKEGMKAIPLKGKEVVLSVIGNHSKGTQFLNGNHLIGPELNDRINEICGHMSEWYYGRLDIKYADFDAFLAGNDFKILEINGIISEPTHIYDASSEGAGYFSALASINKHWSIMSEIARVNHHDRGVPYPGIMEHINNLIDLRRYSRKLKAMNQLDV